MGRAKSESSDCEVITSERGQGLISELVKKIKNKKVCTDCQNYQMMESLKKSVPKIKHSTRSILQCKNNQRFSGNCCFKESFKNN